MEAETPGVSEQPTPHAHTEVDPRTPTVEKPDGLALPVPGPESHQDSLISGTISQGDSLAAPSQRDSFLSVSNSQRDSLLSVSNSQRDSLSSTHTQTLLLHGRPLSALTIDSGSPSHVALAHRVPVAVTDITGVGRGRAVFVPGRDTSPRIPSDGEGFPPSPEEEQTQRDVDAHIQAPAPPTQRHPLPSARAQRPGTTYTPEPVTPPRRHAYTTGAPRPYTAYVPPADDADEDGVGEFGTVSFGGGQPRSFTAVVHGRVREGGSGWDSGNTKWDAGTSNGWDGREREREEKRLPLPPMPLSPGFASGELAELLAQAASLEQRLEKGELPGEALRRMSMRPGPSNASASQAPPPAVPPIPTPAGATVKSQRSFRNPLTRSRSERRPKAQRDREEGHPVASSSMGNLLAMQIAPSAHADPLPPSLGWSKSSTQLVPLEVIPLSPTNSDVPPTPPPKSPGFGGGTRYFSSLRRLASTTRALNSPGAPGARGSVSTSSELSSEDSMGLATPPDDAAAVNPATGSAVTWPSLSSKKSVGSIGRGAATLAGKMWHRTRSKSSTSTVSSIEASPPPPLPIPALPSPPVLKLDQTPFIIPPIQTSLYGQDSSETPTNRTPNGGPHSALSSATPTASKPTQLPKSKSYTAPTRPPHLTLNSSASSPGALLPVPNTAPESRPISWTSVSSGGSSSVATSPMFDKAIFDAFPSVPEMPLPQSHSARVGSYGHANSVHSSGMNSPAAHVRPLPLSPPGFNSDSSTSTPTFSDRSFTRGGTPGTYDNQPLLARVGETQRRVDTLL
ncbi:hypothetical protein C8R43DRAFT_345581 [Mycena crocata]|nr:hypothetical protein C8R43DRAFT_345581 [Mycena crocata]